MTTIFNSIVPIFALVFLGSVLKRIGITDETYIRVSDKLVYFIFFPALLFWKIGKPAPSAGVDWQLVVAVLISVFVVFVISLATARLLGVTNHEVGSFAQGCIRFNSYIGLAVVLAVLGDDGIRGFGVLIGFVIPFINVLVVGTLIWFSRESYSMSHKAVLLVKSMVSNPLIIACLAGIGYSSLNVSFPVFVDSTLAMMSFLPLPLALISIGGSMTLSGFRGHLFKSSAAAVFKLAILPVVGYFVVKFLGVSDQGAKLAIIFFALPTSPAGYILSAQLDSDVDLATASIVLSTLLSIGSLSVVLLAFGA